MNLDDLLAKVQAEKTVDDSIIALLTTFSQELKDGLANNDQAKIQAVSDAIDANIKAITDAVTANTPATTGTATGTTSAATDGTGTGATGTSTTPDPNAPVGDEHLNLQSNP